MTVLLPLPFIVLLILQGQVHIVHPPENIVTYHQMELVFPFQKHIDYSFMFDASSYLCLCVLPTII